MTTEMVSCYVCKKMIDKDKALAIGNDLHRCKNHRASSILKAEKPKPADSPTVPEPDMIEVCKKIETVQIATCPHCGKRMAIRGAKI